MSATVRGADAWLGARLGGEVFTEETEVRKGQALTSAADVLALYLNRLHGNDADVAVYEQALWMLGSNAEMQAAGVTSFSVGGISQSYDLKGRPENIAPAAWRIIKNAVSGGEGRGGGAVWLS